MQTGTNFSESFTTVYEDELSFLEKTVDDYPVSALSLFLLLQNYKKTGDERYDHLIRKAALYFSNHNWLDYQLSGDESMNYIPEKELKEEVENPSEIEDLSEAAFSEPEIYPENKPENPEEAVIENSLEEEAIREMEKEEMVEFVQGEEADNFEESFVVNELNPEEEIITVDSSEEKQEGEKIEKVEEEIENKLPEVFQENKLPGVFAGETISDTLAPEESSEKFDVVCRSEELNATDHSESVGNESETEEERESEKPEENQPLEFEPLHTIDYFASQGIIIREEALMNDKLGKQMKSFTDWLKSMKKLHPGKLPEQNEVVEKIIQSSAELSNEDAGVLTEAMADVLIKQGKKAKAIEMFEKLSLMNPSKSIYFAAKIESLKNN